MNQTIKPILLGSFVIIFIILAGIFFSNEDNDTFNIGPSIITLNEGEQFNLETQNTGLFEDRIFNVTSIDSSVVSVEGLVIEAMSPGATTLNATIEGSDEIITIQVEVLEVIESVELYEVVFENTTLNNITVEAGSSIELPSLDVDGYQFEGWLDEDGEFIEEILEVDSDIRLTPVLNKLLESITISQPNNDLLVGSMIDLDVILNPLDFDLLDLSYDVSNDDIATIDETGSVTFLEAGTVIVTVTDLISNISESIELLVTEPEETIYYTVSFDLGNGQTMDPVIVEAGHRLNLEEIPTREDSVFRNWVLDRNYTSEKIITNDDFIYRDMTLTAVWGLESLAIQTVNGVIYKDVSESDNPYFTYELLNEDGSFFAFGITKPSELQAMGMNLSFSAVLMNDITLPDPTSTYFYPRFGELGEVIKALHESGLQDINRFDPLNTNFLPIGHSEAPYLGSFYGNGFKISNMQISTYGYYNDLYDNNEATILQADYGLIGYSYSDALNPVEISYLTFEDAFIETQVNDDENTGILVGALRGENHQVSHILVKENSTIYGKYDVGGIIGDVGTDHSTFTAITNYANIYVTNDDDDGGDIGGIVGYHDANFTTFIDIKNYGDVTGKYDVGGFIGDLETSDQTFINIENHGDITSSSDDTGGIIGYLDGSRVTLRYVTNTGIVKGSTQTGGIIGEIDDGDDTHLFEFLYNYGDVISINGGGNIGGIIGYVDSDDNTDDNVFRYFYNYGNVSGGDNNVGGIIGDLEYSSNFVFEHFYNYGLITGENDTGGIFGDFAGEDHVLKYTYNYGDVSGSDANVGGIIGDLEYSFNFVFEHFYNYGLITGEDDLGGIFGDFTGEDHVLNNMFNYGTISGILADESNFGGIIGDLEDNVDSNNHVFRHLYNYGTILGYEDTGGLVGYFDAYDIIFENSQNFGRVEGTNNVGGIIGYLTEDNLSFFNITNSGVVVGSSYDVGGIIGLVEPGYGWNTSLINVANLADVSGNRNVGGIIGNLASSLRMTFTNIINNGNITSELNGAGGIFGVGELDSSEFNTIINNAIILANGNAGGLFGVLEGDHISASSLTNNGNVSLVAIDGSLFQNVGGIVGDLASGEYQTFNGLSNYGAINGTRDTGGLFGDVSGDGSAKYLTLEDSHNYGVILGTNQVGGIFGAIYDEYVTLSGITNQGEIIGLDGVGGLIGIMDDSNLFIYNSTNSSILNGLDGVGGMIGNMDYDGLRLENVYSSFTINGSSSLGGLIGSLMGNTGISDLHISSAVIEGNIISSSSGESEIGGAIGYLYGHILSSGVTLNVNITAVSASGVGGYIGDMDGFGGTFDNSSIDGTIQAFENVGGLIGKFERVSGSSIDVTIIDHDISGDIDADGLNVGGYIGQYIDDVGRLHIWTSNFSGSILASGDVGGFIGESLGDVTLFNLINHANITGMNQVGGFVGSHSLGDLSLIQLTNAGVISGFEKVGGIVGNSNMNTATFGLLSNTSEIRGYSNNIGGLFGYLDIHNVEILDSLNTGDVVFDDSHNPTGSAVGGLVGFASATFRLEFDNNVVSTPAITGTTEVGGIVGFVDISSNTANALFVTNNTISGTILASTIGERGALFGKVLTSSAIINESSNDTSNVTLLPAS